jgi:hypothetical protein
MELRNQTACHTLAFKGRSILDEPFHVIVLRSTWSIPSTGPMLLLPEQEPLVMADTYHGAPGRSSPRVESDLAPYKPRADISVVGSARAPGGVPTAAWEASVRVGSLAKTVRVTGPRRWERARDWALSEPEACTEVPLCYELAFGGTARHRDGRDAPFAENPVGLGHAPAGSLDDVDVVPAPQIESPDDPIRELGVTHRPVGFGLLGRAWEPRLARAGTYDDAWLAHTWPRLPDNFDFAYWNAAPADLTAPRWLVGDEAVELTGLFADGPRRFQLPGVWVYALAIPHDGPAIPYPMKLDTVSFDVDAARASLTWRLALPIEPALAAIEPRMARKVVT